MLLNFSNDLVVSVENWSINQTVDVCGFGQPPIQTVWQTVHLTYEIVYLHVVKVHQWKTLVDWIIF